MSKIVIKYGDLPRNQFTRADGVRLATTVLGPSSVSKPKTVPIGTIALNKSNPKEEFYDLHQLHPIHPEEYLVVNTLTQSHKNDASLAIIGKGVAFDAGGMNIKTGSSMRGMKYDKTGALVALDIGLAIKERKIKKNVHIITPFVENLVSPTALMPDDILTYRLGTKTHKVEIDNTDAEGRLILADGMLEAQARGVNRMMTIATLTGHISYALGDRVVGIMGNATEDMQALVEIFTKHNVESEILTLRDQHRKAIRAPNKKIADIVNCSKLGKAGAQTAAAFLETFVYTKNTRWIHLDIAGFEGIAAKVPSKLVAPIVEFTKQWR